MTRAAGRSQVQVEADRTEPCGVERDSETQPEVEELCECVGRLLSPLREARRGAGGGCGGGRGDVSGASEAGRFAYAREAAKRTAEIPVGSAAAEGASNRRAAAPLRRDQEGARRDPSIRSRSGGCSLRWGRRARCRVPRGGVGPPEQGEWCGA